MFIYFKSIWDTCLYLFAFSNFYLIKNRKQIIIILKSKNIFILIIKWKNTLKKNTLWLLSI